jgi:hypothetical protein
MHVMTYLAFPAQMNLAEQDLGFTQSQLALVDVSAALAEERDREIRKIVQTIVELTQVCEGSVLGTCLQALHCTGRHAQFNAAGICIGSICDTSVLKPLFHYLRYASLMYSDHD